MRLSVATCFDMVAGTSTGGILALGIGLGIPCTQIYNIYASEGNKIFPPVGNGFIGKLRRATLWTRRIFTHGYKSAPLEAALKKVFGNRRLGESVVPLCIPAYEALHGEPYVYKTRHHPRYKLDHLKKCVDIGLATTAAPTFFKPHQNEGYVMLDGGVLANNPIMVAVVDALACFNLKPQQIQVVSVGFGDKPYAIPRWKTAWGGMFVHRALAIGMMSIQSQNALGQAKLLIGGPEGILRITPDYQCKPFDLDDYDRSIADLPSAAIQKYTELKNEIRKFTDPRPTTIRKVTIFPNNKNKPRYMSL